MKPTDLRGILRPRCSLFCGSTWCSQTGCLPAGTGLDVAAWKTCYQAQATADAVAADVRAGRSAGVTGTPAFVLNGAAVARVPSDQAGWRQLLDAALKK